MNNSAAQLAEEVEELIEEATEALKKLSVFAPVPRKLLQAECDKFRSEFIGAKGRFKLMLLNVWNAGDFEGKSLLIKRVYDNMDAASEGYQSITRYFNNFATCQ